MWISGLRYPDITRGDGVYFSYVPMFARYSGYHEIKIDTENSGNSLVYKQDMSETRAICCGSQMMYAKGDPTGKFSRYITGPSYFISRINSLQKDITLPSRISNFHVVWMNISMLSMNLTWTAPGGDFDSGQVNRYEIWCHLNPELLLGETFVEKGILIHIIKPIITTSYGDNQIARVGIP